MAPPIHLLPRAHSNHPQQGISIAPAVSSVSASPFPSQSLLLAPMPGQQPRTTATNLITPSSSSSSVASGGGYGGYSSSTSTAPSSVWGGFLTSTPPPSPCKPPRPRPSARTFHADEGHSTTTTASPVPTAVDEAIGRRHHLGSRERRFLCVFCCNHHHHHCGRLCRSRSSLSSSSGR